MRTAARGEQQRSETASGRIDDDQRNFVLPGHGTIRRPASARYTLLSRAAKILAKDELLVCSRFYWSGSLQLGDDAH